MSLIALIPARGGSKGVPGKNTKLLAGIPLIAHTIRAAQKVSKIQRIIVSTDDCHIAEVAMSWGAEVPFMRPAELASDETPGIAPVLHALEKIPEASELLLLQPTSPLRTYLDIEGILSFKKARNCQSVVSICESDSHPQWMYRMNDQNALNPYLTTSPAQLRQALDTVYCLNGALYLCDRIWLETFQKFVGSETLGYIMPPERSVDIDTHLDWLWAETLLRHSEESHS